jgi:hypothetical protein
MTKQTKTATVDQVCDLLATWETDSEDLAFENAEKYKAVARHVFVMLSAPDTIELLIEFAGHADIAKRVTRGLLDRIALDALPKTGDGGWPLHDRFCPRNLYENIHGQDSHISKYQLDRALNPKQETTDDQ